MTQEEKIHLIEVHRHLSKAAQSEDRQALVDAVHLMAQRPDFQRVLNENRERLAWPPRTQAELHAVAFAYLMMWLMRRDYEAGATLCWGNDPKDSLFTSEPRSVKLVWKAMANQRLINLLGGASQGKTMSASAWALMDWIVDPDWTLVRVMSTKEEHVKKNLFADMVRLWQGSVVPLPGAVDSESISTTRGKLGGQGIFLIVIPRGTDSGATIKGSKVKPRPAHPIFGTSSRTRLIIDEAQDVPESAFDEISNLFASIEEDDVEHTKIVMAANPKDEFSRYGQNCVPVQGWENIQTRDSPIDEWESTTGWWCVRLNALKSENVVQGKTVYARFFTLNGYKMKLRAVGGDTDHPLIWAEVYGMFPPKGSMSVIIQKHWIDKSYREWVFIQATTACAGEDVGFTGDAPAMGSLRVGEASAYVDFKGVRHELPAPRCVLQIDTVGTMQRGDTQELADQTFDRVRPLGVKPGNFGIDRTGVGQGTHDIIRRQWRKKVDKLDIPEVVDIVGIHYAESASKVKVADEDTKLPDELYDGVRTEMWYAFARLLEYDCVGIGKGVPVTVIEQLTNRRGGSPTGKGKKLAVESKDEYKDRHGGKSPDEADALLIGVHVARTTIRELIPRAPDTIVARPKPFNVLTGPRDGMNFGEPMNMDFNMGIDSKELRENRD